MQEERWTEQVDRRKGRKDGLMDRQVDRRTGIQEGWTEGQTGRQKDMYTGRMD